MGVVGDGTVVAPFANAAMRLLREDWKGKYGSKMLAEELFPILQTGIPRPDANFLNYITVNAGSDNQFAALIDKFGQTLYQIDASNGLQKIEAPGYPPAKLKPRIVWEAKTIGAGGSIGGSELDAVAKDPETGATIAGVYVYDPASGTTFLTAGKATLYVNFTPTDGVKYRRAMGSTVLTIVAGGVWEPSIVWAGSASEILGGRLLDGDILNAVAIDPRDGVTVVPGIFTYTPPAGTVLTGNTSPALHVDFVPTDNITFTTSSSDITINVLTIDLQARGAAPAVVVGEIILVRVISGNTDVGSEPADMTVTVTDSLGNTYVQVGGYMNAHQISATPPFDALKNTISMWYAVVTNPGTATITVTPSSGFGVAGFTNVIVRGNTSSPVDGNVTHSAAIDDDPETVSTTTIPCTAAAGQLELFVGYWNYVTTAATSGGDHTFPSYTPTISATAQNMTEALSGAVTSPAATYNAMGASFKQKPSV